MLINELAFYALVGILKNNGDNIRKNILIILRLMFESVSFNKVNFRKNVLL
jgi:hypothetical protein